LFDLQLEKGSRDFFKNQHIPTWLEHKAWLQNAIVNELIDLRIVLNESSLAGYVRADIEPLTSQVDVSVMIKKNFRSLGLAIKGLKLLFDEPVYCDKHLRAQVHRDNLASIRLFGNLGFTLVENRDRFIQMEKKIEKTCARKNS
jgi:L-amino acid N-acyltransferase YncA